MIKKGTKVKWKWGSGEAQGKVLETFTDEIHKTIKGAKITRKGTRDNKAILIEQEDGDQVLKLESEVEKA